MMATIDVLKPGFQTTVQDAGRPDHLIDGFPEAGSMDAQAMKVANILVDNQPDQPVLEFTLHGPSLRFNGSGFIAITGADFAVQLNQQPVDQYRCLQVQAGDLLTIGATSTGRFGYLAVSGGFRLPKVMGSCATILRLHLGGYRGRQLRAGDQLPFSSRATMSSYYHRHTAAPAPSQPKAPVSIRLLPGPQWAEFSHADQERLTASTFEVTSNSDRMGYRLQGPRLESSQQSMLSAATVRGGIQVPNNGQPIVLMADRQTTGGYPLIAVVVTADLSKLVQCRPGQKVKFSLVNLAQATKLLRTQRAQLDHLAVQIRAAKYQQPIGRNRVASRRIQQLFD
ncbi:biotin-dependent carboxyltransferase family protein [Limosilactobacillus antri]|uniref:5-oxoprolinase subunit C family protein n=1 Tax=Limosilactobacillus antri TaxID=227943 RepID=UPI001F55EA27|nr:biotin-dependent carboxyltransferase family protein [Limosilactobacillus antri]